MLWFKKKAPIKYHVRLNKNHRARLRTIAKTLSDIPYTINIDNEMTNCMHTGNFKEKFVYDLLSSEYKVGMSKHILAQYAAIADEFGCDVSKVKRAGIKLEDLRHAFMKTNKPYFAYEYCRYKKVNFNKYHAEQAAIEDVLTAIEDIYYEAINKENIKENTNENV